MRSGIMNKNLILLLLVMSLAIISCKQERKQYITFSLPAAGAKINAGNSINAKLDLEELAGIDSIVYFIDTMKIVSSRDTSGVKLSTTGIALGNHVLQANIYRKEAVEEITTNILIVAASAPIRYTYKIVNTYPHDAESYVQGLEYHGGHLYESAGQLGRSSVRKVELSTGKILQMTKLEDQYFAEGITIVGDKIVQITYQQNTGFVYDLNTLKQIKTFSYPSNREGWGLAFDGNVIFNTSGSSSIYILNKDSYQTEGYIQVFDNNGPVDSLNELEYIDGKIYANVYKLDGPYANKVVIIDPKTGVVEGVINLIGLHPLPSKAHDSDYILNGIAYDKASKRLFVTGKLWPKLFEIEIVATNSP